MIEKIKQMLFKTCPQTGKIRGVKFKNKWYYYFGFPVLGLAATLWILIRVIPKPSRLRYPCMKVAIPISSSFFVFLGGIITSMLSFHKIKNLLKNKKVSVPIISIFILLGFSGIIMTVSGLSVPGIAKYKTVQQPPNQPMGEAQGIFPGRVVWVHDPEATNQSCIPDKYGDGWYLNKHNDQEVIDEMLNKALLELSGTTEIKSAWDTLFKFHNQQRGKAAVNYQAGEKIFIKINLTSAWGMGEFWGNINDDFSIANNDWYGISETSPQLILSLLRQLVNVVGVAEDDIYVGDPMKHIYKYRYDLWYDEFPDVHYLDYDKNSSGREKVEVCDSAVIDYSDRGSIIAENTDSFYQIFKDCEYMLNVPTLKGHKRAGVTMFAKNHFGSHTRSSANHLHPGLVNPDEEKGTGDERYGYGKYRVLTDIMGSELLREKNLFYLMDALWAAGMEITQPTKWKTKPFNNDWCSSLFISQDQVAIESVGYDFLRNEYTEENHPDETYVQMEGTDDYLEQAADSANWPEGIIYDPENDGTPIPSLGVHEHWNNAEDKLYTRNLGTGDGIELVKVLTTGRTQNDTVIAHIAETAPEIDGSDDDNCWNNAIWQSIGQTWMPYNAYVSALDFSGRYKISWSKDENLLYFLVETYDDQLVDGYEQGADNYFSYDVVEVFIDEDRSGGMHRIDNNSENAENAFSYHINTDFPAIGDTNKTMHAMDIAGFWDKVEYTSHFEDFTIQSYQDKNVWEFALKVYDDSYDPDNPEGSLVTLSNNKIMGLSLAYCDNDDPDEEPKTRDNFFGSVAVAHEDSNSHWKNADDYGVVKLYDPNATGIIADNSNQIPGEYRLSQNYPNPFNPVTRIEYNLPIDSKVELTVYDLAGRKVKTLVNKQQLAGQHSVNWNASGFASGVYFYRIRTDNFSDMKKCVLVK